VTTTAIIVRPADPGDHEPLAAFECSTRMPFEDEVQHYVRTRAYSDSLKLDGYHLWVVEQGERLIGCLAWLPELIPVSNAEVIPAWRLQVLAIATTHQGLVLPHGGRLSDALMQTAMVQALKPSAGHGVITGVAAVDNIRSIRLCERNGLTSQTRFGHGYVRLLGAFGEPPSERF
jgi:hypothetical protein